MFFYYVFEVIFPFWTNAALLNFSLLNNAEKVSLFPEKYEAAQMYYSDTKDWSNGCWKLSFVIK